MSEKPPIAGENDGLSPALLDTLICDIGTLASVYHKPAETFVAGKKFGADNVNKTITEYVTKHHNAKDKKKLIHFNIDMLKMMMSMLHLLKYKLLSKTMILATCLIWIGTSLLLKHPNHLSRLHNRLNKDHLMTCYPLADHSQ